MTKLVTLIIHIAGEIIGRPSLMERNMKVFGSSYSLLMNAVK